jgi:hypothetical protein
MTKIIIFLQSLRTYSVLGELYLVLHTKENTPFLLEIQIHLASFSSIFCANWKDSCPQRQQIPSHCITSPAMSKANITN